MSASVIQFHYIGVAADTKPTVGPQNQFLTVGSLFEELDTGAMFYWTGAVWSAKPASTAVIGGVTVAAGEAHIGQIGGATDLISVTLSLDTAIYASGDVLADTQVITNAVRVTGGRAVLQSIMVIDEDDQGAAFTIYILGANNAMGTENGAPSITDASARDIQAVIDIATTDYKDLGGVKVANLRGIGAVVEAAGGSRDLYVAVVNGTGAPTYTASGVKLVLGFLQD